MVTVEVKVTFSPSVTVSGAATVVTEILVSETTSWQLEKRDVLPAGSVAVAVMIWPKESDR